MPIKKEHVEKAEGAATIALAFQLDNQAKIDWALIMLFYAAMHYVEAYLSKSNVHLRSHTTRDNAISRDSRLRKIYKEYADLKFYGYNARYEYYGFKREDVTDRATKHYSAVKTHIQQFL